MADRAYVRALERAEFILGPPRTKGTVIWSGAGMSAVRHLVGAFRSLVAERYAPTLVEHGFLADGPAYRAVFGGYANVYEVAPEAARHGGSLLRPDNLVTTVAGLRAAGTVEPRIAVGGLLRRFDGSTPPLFRDRYIWPAVQLTQRVAPGQALAILDFYRVVVERLFARVGLPAITVRTPTLADYGRVTYLVVSALPNGRPTVLATLYVLAAKLRRSFGEDLDLIDVGFTGKVIATCAMLHADTRGLLLPSALAPIQVGVTARPWTDMARVDGWLKTVRDDGVRAEVRVAARTDNSRNRLERRWHARGVPVVVGLDQRRGAAVVRATRGPLLRAALPGLPDAERLRADLADHDARLLRAGQRVLSRSVSHGRYLRTACAACADQLPVFGTVVPPQRGPCEMCVAATGQLVFVSEEGRFY